MSTGGADRVGIRTKKLETQLPAILYFNAKCENFG